MWMYAFSHSLIRLIVICFVRSQDVPFALGLSRIERENKQLQFGLLAGFLAILSVLCLLCAGIGFTQATGVITRSPLEPHPSVPLFWGILFAVMTRGALLQRAQFDGIVDLVPGIDLDEDGEPHHRPLKPEPLRPASEEDVARRVVAAAANGNLPRPSESDVELNALPTDQR